MVSRRNLLAAIGTGTTFSLSGCLGGINPETKGKGGTKGGGTPSNSVFKSVRVVNTESGAVLEVRIREEPRVDDRGAVDRINLVDDRGELVTSESVAVGQTLVRIPLQSRGQLGIRTSYRLFAVDEVAVTDDDFQSDHSVEYAEIAIENTGGDLSATIEEVGDW